MPLRIKKSPVLWISIGLAVSTLLVFWQVRNFDFVNYDDNAYVYENPRVLSGITVDNIRWAFTAGHASNWHPLTWLSLMLDCQLFRAASLPGGPNPGKMHLVNVFFHLANTLLLFTVLKQMTGALWQSAFVAALFAVHPLHVESVAWVSERKDVLSTLFWLLTMWAYLQYVRQPKIWRYLLTMLFFALGLMAKPMLVTLPFVLLLLDYWPLERFGQRKIFYLVREKIPFFILVAVSGAVTFFVQRSSGAVVGANAFLLRNRFANAALSYSRYIAKMFWPRNLAVFYPFNDAGLPFWQIAASVLILLGLSVLVIRFGRRQKYLPLGWFWFLGTLVPVIGIVQVGAQAMADRYTYIPYIGLFIMLAWLVPKLLEKLPQRKFVLGLTMILSLSALAVIAHRQTSRWKNSITLFSHTVEVVQDSWLAYNNLGVAYSVEEQWTQAAPLYEQAVKINPRYSEAYANLGYVYSVLKRYDDAIAAYQRAVQIRPTYVEALNNLGMVYSNLGLYQQEVDVYLRMLEIRPDSAQTYNNLGAAYDNLRRYRDAIEAYKQAIRLKPDLAEAHANIAYIYLRLGDKASAVKEYNILKSLHPQFAEELGKYINK
jgi:tetratricopeptide (TPR) repeat protein